MRKAVMVLFLAISVGMTIGCASTVPQAAFSQSLAPASRIAATDEVTVNVQAKDGVDMLPSEKTLLAEIIDQKIDLRKVTNNREGETRDYEVNLLVTRFDKGSAFARAMLAGLGQIHIDGEVTLIKLPERNEEGRFSLKKTFAWGGIYGASTSMEDIEKTFADGVAAALTGQQEEQKK